MAEAEWQHVIAKGKVGVAATGQWDEPVIRMPRVSGLWREMVDHVSLS